METKIYTVEEYKQLFLEGVINKSAGKVSKVSDNSVLGGGWVRYREDLSEDSEGHRTSRI